MKKIYLLFLFALLSVNTIIAQCTETDVTRIMLIGDSWAAMMNTDNTINSVFQNGAIPITNSSPMLFSRRMAPRLPTSCNKTDWMKYKPSYWRIPILISFI